MDIAIGVAVGSATQIALLVIPLCVIFGAIFGRRLSLYFEGFETVRIAANSLARHDDVTRRVAQATTLSCVLMIAFVVVDGAGSSHSHVLIPHKTSR